MKKRKPLGESRFHRIATFIVDKRHLFFVLYLFAIVFCLFSMKWVTVENDITNYLPEDTESPHLLWTNATCFLCCTCSPSCFACFP